MSNVSNNSLCFGHLERRPDWLMLLDSQSVCFLSLCAPTLLLSALVHVRHSQELIYIVLLFSFDLT